MAEIYFWILNFIGEGTKQKNKNLTPETRVP